MKFCETINYEYNKKRKFLANLAAYYLKLKIVLKQKRELIRKEVIILYNDGTTAKQLMVMYKKDVNKNLRFLSMLRNTANRKKLVKEYS